MNRSAATILMSLVLLACLQVSCNTAEAVKGDKDKKLVFLAYGKPPNQQMQIAVKKIAAKWGFGYKRIAGCVVTHAFTDSVDNLNDKVENVLANKFGNNWRVKYEKEVDAEFDREVLNEKKVTALLDQQKTNIDKRIELKKQNAQLDYDLTPLDDGLSYKVNAEGFVEINGKYEIVTYYTYLVDLKTSTVKLLSNNTKTL